MDPLPEGSMSTLMDAKQEEVAVYQHKESFVSWHLLEGNTEISTDAFSSLVKRDAPQTKIILSHQYNTDNTLHLKNFQFFSTFSPSDFAFPTIRSSSNIFQGYLGH